MRRVRKADKGMIKKQFVFIDKNVHYLERVQDYLVRKNLADFQIVVYTDLQQAMADSKKNAFEIVAISEACYDEEKINNLCAVHGFLLRESTTNLVCSYQMIEKYQSMDEILKQILTSYTMDVGEKLLAKRGKRAKVISFYNSKAGELSTLYALAAGELLAKERKNVLYINLHPFSGLEGLIKQSFSCDLTDVIYYGLQHSEKFGSRIDSCKNVFQGVNILPVMDDYGDLLSLTREEWREWFASMVYEAGYEILIVDFSGLSLGAEVFFADSDIIYMLEADSPWERASQAKLEEWLIKKALTESRSCIKVLPEQEKEAWEIENVMYNKIGRQIKQQLTEDGFL